MGWRKEGWTAAAKREEFNWDFQGLVGMKLGENWRQSWRARCWLDLSSGSSLFGAVAANSQSIRIRRCCAASARLHCLLLACCCRERVTGSWEKSQDLTVEPRKRERWRVEVQMLQSAECSAAGVLQQWKARRTADGGRRAGAQTWTNKWKERPTEPTDGGKTRRMADEMRAPSWAGGDT